MRCWLLELVLPAAARLAWVHFVRGFDARFAVRTPRLLRCPSAPRHASILALLIIIAILARAAPERPPVATSRILALLGELVIPERVLAIVGRHAPPGRWLDAVIGTATHQRQSLRGMR